MTNVRFGCSHLQSSGQLTHTRRSDVGPDPDGTLKKEVRIKIRHYRNLYLNRPESITFLSLTVDTSDRVYDDFIRLLLLHPDPESSVLTNELPEVSDQFRFLRVTCLFNLKWSAGLILTNTSVMRIFIPHHLSPRSFIPLSCFIRSRCPTPILVHSMVFTIHKVDRTVRSFFLFYFFVLQTLVSFVVLTRIWRSKSRDLGGDPNSNWVHNDW